MGEGMSAGAVARGEREKGVAGPRTRKMPKLVAQPSVESLMLEALRALWSFSKGPGARAVVVELARKYREDCAARQVAVVDPLVRSSLESAQAVCRNLKKLGGGTFGAQEMVERLEKHLAEAVGGLEGKGCTGN